jgi:two-component system CitB family sensor kinase
VAFATEELQTAQVLTDVVVGAVEEPVVAAVLLGKSAQAAERGIDLVIDEDTAVSALVVEPRDVVTILGNLLDNAFDAVTAADDKQVHVRVHADTDGLEVDVDDSGDGLPEDVREQVFRRGWSTKRGDEAVGRGLGLALVGQVVRRHGGRVAVEDSPLGGARFTVRIGGTS